MTEVYAVKLINSRNKTESIKQPSCFFVVIPDLIF